LWPLEDMAMGGKEYKLKLALQIKQKPPLGKSEERERERAPDNITVREATTAEEIFTTFSKKMLKAKLVAI
jgi:hypothetical protein